MDSLQPIAFMSYAHFDDDNDAGYLTQLRARLEAEVRAQTGNTFPIFQDRHDIGWGQNWKARIQDSLNNVTFLIPIITPSYFKSQACREELQQFIEREEKLGRDDLILPIYYIESQLEDKKKLAADELVRSIGSHQYVNWLDLRRKPFKNIAVRSRLISMADHIRKALDRLDFKEAPAVEYSEQDISEYLTFLIRQFATLDPRGLLRGAKTHDVILSLEDVFITLRAGPNNPWEREAEQTLLDLDVEEQFERLGISLLDQLELGTTAHEFRYANLVREAHMLIERRLRENETLNFDEAFREQRWLAILGDPGSGKTTLMHWIALQLAKAFLAKKERVLVSGEALGHHGENIQVDLGPTRFPIIVRIADFSAARRENASLTLYDYLGHQPILGEYCSVPRDKLAAMSRNFLAQAQAVLLLDGLDEIVDASDRRRIRDQIERFVQDFVKDPSNERTPMSSFVSSGPSAVDAQPWWFIPELSTPVELGGNQVVITSRVAGYRNAVLRGEFKHYLVEPLDDDAIRRFCNKWTLAVELYLARQAGVASPQAENKASLEAKSLTDEIFRSKGVRKLATNPLLLTILALLHREQSRLPAHRIELYRQAVKHLIERRETTLTEPQVVDILSPFALWLLENEPTGLATETELREWIGIGFKRWLGIEYSDELPGKFIQEIEDFIILAREQTGLLVARGEGLYAFTHLTFQEYLVARELTRRPSKVKENLLKYLHRPRWQEALLLAVANVSAVQRGDLAEVMGSLLDAPSEHEDVLHRNLLFAAYCVADTIWMPPQVLREITNELIGLYANKTGPGRFRALRKQLIEAFEHIYRSDTAEIVENITVSILKGNKASLRAGAGEILARVSWESEELLKACIEALKLPGVSSPLIDAVNALIERRAVSEEKLPEIGLVTLEYWRKHDPQIQSALDILSEKTPERLPFLERYGHSVNPIIVPLIVRLARKYDDTAPESFASTFWLQLQGILTSITESTAGLAYTSAFTALTLLDNPDTVIHKIRNNILIGRNREESTDLYINSFLPAIDNSFDRWWHILPSEIKFQFFESAIGNDKSRVLEKQAWAALGDEDNELGKVALALLLSLRSVVLSAEHLDTLESYISSSSHDLAETVGDILERGILSENPDARDRINEKLDKWLVSENDALRAFGVILLATSDPITLETYRGLIEILRNNDDRLRQFADRVMSIAHPASGLPSEIMDQAPEAMWHESYVRHDGLASLAHENFLRCVVHDIPDFIENWIEKLASAGSEREKEVIANALSTVELCTPPIFEYFLGLLEHSESPFVLESLLDSLSRIARDKVFEEVPVGVFPVLDKIVRDNGDYDLKVFAAETIGSFNTRNSYDILDSLSSSERSEIRSAAIEGLGTIALYNADVRNTIYERVSSLLKAPQSLSEPRLQQAIIKTWIRSLILSRLTSAEVVQRIVENADTDIFDSILKAGDGNDVWDEIICDDNAGFHSKLIEVIRFMVTRHPTLLDDLTRRVLAVLDLRGSAWVRKRLPLGALATCAQDLPANLAQLPSAGELESHLLDAAVDPHSFNMRRFALITLGQFRRLSSRILSVLAAGCRDLIIVQQATFQAIRGLRIIDTEALPELIQLLSSPSTTTKYAATLIMREIGNSAQAVRQLGLRTSIANGLAQCIREITYPRYVYVDEDFVGKLDDILFTTLVQVTADNPRELLSEEFIAESRLAVTSLREISATQATIPEDLRQLQAQAQKMQQMLQAENIVIQKSGILVVMGGDQKFERITIQEIQKDDLTDLLNDLIKQTQQMAARFLLEISSISLEEAPATEEEEGMPLEFLRLRRQAQQMQNRLQAEHFKTEKDDIQVVIRGDQVFESIKIEETEQAELVAALNEALQRSQELAAQQLIQLSTQPQAEKTSSNWIESLQNFAKVQAEALLTISFPYSEASIYKVDYSIDNGFFNLILFIQGSLIFDRKNVIFTKGDSLPALVEVEIKETEEAEHPDAWKYVISIPYEDGSINSASYEIADNYFHLRIKGRMGLSFDENNVRFSKLTASSEDFE